MAKKTEQRVTKAPTKAMKRREDVPAWVTEGTAGFEGTNAQDLVLPRLQVCQALSPQRQKKDPAYIQGLEEGDFFNSVTKENYGGGPHLLTPLLCSKSRLKFVDVKKPGSGVDCMGIPCGASAKNPEGIACRLNSGGPCLHQSLDDEDPCFLLYNFPVVLHEHTESPVVLSFKSTGVKVARAWLSMMRMRGRFPMYAMAFSVESVDASNAKGNFKQAKIDNAGWTSEEMAEELKALYESIANKVILTDQEDEGREDREPGEM